MLNLNDVSPKRPYTFITVPRLVASKVTAKENFVLIDVFSKEKIFLDLNSTVDESLFDSFSFFPLFATGTSAARSD